MEMSRRALMAAAGAAVVAAVIPWPEARSAIEPIPTGEAWPWREPKSAVVTLYTQEFDDPLVAVRFAEGLRATGLYEIVKVHEHFYCQIGRKERYFWRVYWVKKEP